MEGERLLEQAAACLKRRQLKVYVEGAGVIRPLSLARILFIRGFLLEALYADCFSADEEEDFYWLAAHFPRLLLRDPSAAAEWKKTGGEGIVIGKGESTRECAVFFVEFPENEENDPIKELAGKLKETVSARRRFSLPVFMRKRICGIKKSLLLF
ncbi:MAG: hypothetical protein K6E30_06155 [Lachnospiraceae bacterium]|nr:hypothetical protein [Lachnospiraceae bacterium]